mmetsp:Transcript_16610/g.20297  ORF Transcript_16610/g.20297 Transcript_16610/m.20297 type:complete len:301 (+) Transcript_16610:125-1027(+)
MSKVMQKRPGFHSTSSSSNLSSLTFSRTWLTAVAKENVDLADKGFYINSSGKEVNVKEGLKKAMKGSKHYHYAKNVKLSEPEKMHDTRFFVCYSLIMKAALTLKKAGAHHVGVLNSASGYNAGGKYGTGCHSLEACICRTSLLSQCLKQFEDKSNAMYKINQNTFKESPSNCAIFSPDVPVIRKDSFEATLLDDYEECSFVSMPPPNALVLESDEVVRKITKEHIRRSLYIFVENGCTDIVLCAFGCGTRENDPNLVAEVFHDLLTNELKGYFNRVLFAINPKKPEEYEAFSSVFEVETA